MEIFIIELTKLCHIKIKRNKMKNTKYHTVGTVPKSIRKNDTPNTQIHDSPLS